RLRQPRWLMVAVPAASLVFAFFASGLVLLATGHDALSSYRRLFDAAFVANGALGQTLVSATPLAFTGLAAAAAFRMRLSNIGGEGQLLVGAITAAAAGLYFGGSAGPPRRATAAGVLGALYTGTRFGFEAQVSGDSPRAARYAGMRTRRKIRAVMAISGAIAGLGGASQDGDFSHNLVADPNGLQRQYYGYSGIVVAALGRYNPLAVLLVAFLIGGLQNAGNTLQGADFPSGLVGVIQGIILFSALGGELLVRYRVRFVRRPTTAAPEPAGTIPWRSS